MLNEMTDDATSSAVQPARDIARIALLGVRFDALRESEVVDRVVSAIRRGEGGFIVTPNLDHLRRCQRDADFRAIVARASYVVADGMPLVWASRLQGTPLPERVAGSSLVSTLAAGAARTGASLFLLGGNEGAADRAAAVLQERHPSLRIAGTHYPPFGFEQNDEQMRVIRDALAHTGPDIVYVALGSPKQEQLIEVLRSEFPRAWFIGVGISLSFLCGEVRRAPRWMQAIGLEWLHRLAQEPGRLFKRYLIHGLPFAFRLFASACIARFRGNR